MKHYHFQQLAPPPARGKFREALFSDPEWWAEEKYDGDRRIAQFLPWTQGRARVRFTGRRISDKDGLFVEKTENVPHLNGAYGDTLAKPSMAGTVLDGEIVCAWSGARSKDVTSIMGSAPNVAIAKQKARGWVRYVVFDCLFYKGRDIRQTPLLGRRRIMEEALSEWNNPFALRSHVVPVHKAEAEVQRIWTRGGEGLIFKHKFSLYGEEKLWVKLKKEFTVDAVIMGYDPPEKVSKKVSGEVSATKFAERGWIGAVRVGQYKGGELVHCGTISGMSDELREELSRRPKKYLMRVVEMEANEREPSGRYRHPRWVQLRDDKNPKDCKWGQV